MLYFEEGSLAVIDERVLSNEHLVRCRIQQPLLAIRNKNGTRVPIVMFDNITRKFVPAAIGKVQKPIKRHASWVGEHAALDVTFVGAHLQNVAAPAIARPHAAHSQLRDVVVHINIMRMSAAITIERKDGVFDDEITWDSGAGGIEKALHVVVNIHVTQSQIISHEIDAGLIPRGLASFAVIFVQHFKVIERRIVPVNHPDTPVVGN